MGKTIAIRDYLTPMSISIPEIRQLEAELKRDLLFYDQIGLCYCDYYLSGRENNFLWKNNDFRLAGKFLDDLSRHGLITDPYGHIFHAMEGGGTALYLPDDAPINIFQKEILKDERLANFDYFYLLSLYTDFDYIVTHERIKDIPNYFNYRKLYPNQLPMIIDHSIRYFATYCNVLFETDCWLPMPNNIHSYREGINSKKQAVYNLLIDKMPCLDVNTPWEKIYEFKEDKESREKFVSFRRWVTNISKSNLTLHEIEDEFDDMVSNYEKHLRLHKMKYEQRRLHLIIDAIGDFFANPIKTLSSSFKIREESINLLEAELKMPAKELAYFSHIKTNFFNK